MATWRRTSRELKVCRPYLNTWWHNIRKDLWKQQTSVQQAMLDSKAIGVAIPNYSVWLIITIIIIVCSAYISGCKIWPEAHTIINNGEKKVKKRYVVYCFVCIGWSCSERRCPCQSSRVLSVACGALYSGGPVRSAIAPTGRAVPSVCHLSLCIAVVLFGAPLPLPVEPCS